MKLNKLNGEGDPNVHLQEFKYLMELKCGINNNLKDKYFPLILTSEARKWFYTLDPRLFSSYNQLKVLFKINFRCNVQQATTLIDMMNFKQGPYERIETFMPRYQKIQRSFKLFKVQH